MNRLILPKSLIITTTILCVLCPVNLLFAKGFPFTSPDDQYSLENQARQYREEGLKYQNIGNLSEAKLFYEKAISLDPNYAVAYNDLGVIYDSEGQLDQAEENYLKAVKIDPAYLSAYTNLAFCYENKRDLKKAEYYWSKRAELGSPSDPWTQKAINRLKDIRLVTNDRTFADERENDVLSLMNDVKKGKDPIDKKNNELALTCFEKAKKSYSKGDVATAIKLALDAQQLDRNNREIEEFIEKAELRALSR